MYTRINDHFSDGLIEYGSLSIEVGEQLTNKVHGFSTSQTVESTARYAMELGYHVTLVRDDATAIVTREMMMQRGT